jgi:hypothetical protein
MFNRTSLKSLAVTAAVAGLIVIAAAGRAEAQVGTGGTIGIGTGGSGGSVLQAGDFFIGIEQTPPTALSVFDTARFFNKARCDCSEPVYILVSLLQSGAAKVSQITSEAGTVSVILGPDCGDILNQDVGNCLPLPNGSEEVLTFLNNQQFLIPTDARTLSTYLNASTAVDAGVSVGACPTNVGQFTQTVNILFDFDGDGVTDLALTQGLLIDLSPPPSPTGVTIQGGDEALVMNWQSLDTSITTDLQGYQILCSRADQYQVFNVLPSDGGGTSAGPFGSAFQTCPATRTGVGVAGLDPTFVCSPLLSAQATSYRVEILQNDITYAASVIAVDNSGNPSPSVVGYGTPVKTLSFYDVYRDETPQGAATGGFCAVTTARPRAKTTAAALSLLAVGAVGVVVARRRRRRR